MNNQGDNVSNIQKPMLAVECPSLETLKYPLSVSEKFDGIRAIISNGQLVSRKLKKIPNNYIRTILEQILPEGSDGEIIAGNTFQECSSNIMSEDGEPDFIFYWFDYVKNDKNKKYIDRMKDVEDYMTNVADSRIQIVKPIICKSSEEVLEFEKVMLTKGKEGVIIRSLDGKYKFGRSTTKEGYLLKLKKFCDAEARIIGFVERLHNNNEAEIDNLGHTKRSLKKANLIPANTLGSLMVKNVKDEIEFEIGTGFDDPLRKEIWDNKEKYLNRLVKYKYTEVGVKIKPRFPVFLGFRDESDM